jgi:hypothetical protein
MQKGKKKGKCTGSNTESHFQKLTTLRTQPTLPNLARHFILYTYRRGNFQSVFQKLRPNGQNRCLFIFHLLSTNLIFSEIPGPSQMACSSVSQLSFHGGTPTHENIYRPEKVSSRECNSITAELLSRKFKHFPLLFCII